MKIKNNLSQLSVMLIIAVALTACDNKIKAGSKQPANNKKPNIVLVLTDDQGYGDLSIHGNPIVKTPAIDTLAKESVSLTNYHVAPTCSPTRAGLLTGRWNNRTGVWHTIMGRSILRANEQTLANLLKDNGYQTAMFGKWHLGDNYPYRPQDRGFDMAYYHGAGGVGQTPDHWDNAYFDDVFSRNGVKESATGFVTDVLFNEAIDYIESVKQSDTPFFTFISANAPHGPMHAPEKYAKMYADENISIKEQHFFGMITNIDDNVAKIRRYLDKENLTNNTIFIFTTDNGTSTGHKVFNANMRGAKNSEYDGGHRVPFFIHWPQGNLAHNTSVDRITSMVDVVPTLLSLSNSKPANVNFDGISITPLLKNPNIESWPSRTLITDSQRVLHPKKWRKSAVMTDKWRLINGKELYDIKADPSQSNDISAKHVETVNKLRAEYDNWWQDISHNFGEPTAIPIGNAQANPVQLTSHDWLGDNAQVPWQQSQIRRAIREKDGKHKGYWYINVETEGMYSFELRRWPPEVDLEIIKGMPAAPPSTGQRAFRETKGEAFHALKANMMIGGESQQTDVSPTDKYVRFTVKLNKGKNKLVATFINENSDELGAYYVSVEKLK
ncbi:arylsulfatase [Thalassotalea crassostreae]|uniref:arylsulfatase n=1 Tax=Thalassotalea crassostreae TaxID=1763536 RepID=UPI0008388669|nr:arylsulfatase [Thalassotalea crassostreae]